ncbi:hypothetical protein [Streptomyces kanamyceticus]|uniref:Uncharacterized protein n=1 Tax=Streptomyces kanamyceticus TaxID=1967 RepID=A0A5J6GNK8_STRKN|nr:hypothetical protein [Streptomyces kanamyceticus]QEU96643.1 hypothetical protein CP970_41950 [Streptomyces kanamyceticus]
MSALPGGQRVLHRLALALEVRDALTSRPVTTPLVVRGEGVGRRFVGDDGSGSRGSDGRFLLLFGPHIGDLADLRITDAARRLVPRRLRIPLWSQDDAAADEQVPPGPHLPALSRTLRVWLAPGSAGGPGPGFTVIRGRVAHGSVPVRWPRIAALGPGGIVVGRAHGDERGEFLLPVTGVGTMPPPVLSRIRVDLLVHARGPGGPPPPTERELALDPLADLPQESVPRSSSPPLPADLDNPLLRGAAPPPGYVPSTAPVSSVDVPVGDLLLLRSPLQFSP